MHSRGTPCPLGNVPSPPPATAQASSTSSELALIIPSKSANPACACISLPYAPPALSARAYQRQPLGRNSPTALSGAAGLGALLAAGPTAAGLRLAQHLQEKSDSLPDIAKKAPKADALTARSCLSRIRPPSHGGRRNPAHPCPHPNWGHPTACTSVWDCPQEGPPPARLLWAPINGSRQEGSIPPHLRGPQKPAQHPLGPAGCLFPSLHRAPAARSAAIP